MAAQHHAPAHLPQGTPSNLLKHTTASASSRTSLNKLSLQGHENLEGPLICSRLQLLELQVLHSERQIQDSKLPSIHRQGVLDPGDTQMGVEAGTDGITVVWQAETNFC